jgi:hypothetical protein
VVAARESGVDGATAVLIEVRESVVKNAEAVAGAKENRVEVSEGPTSSEVEDQNGA